MLNGIPSNRPDFDLNSRPAKQKQQACIRHIVHSFVVKIVPRLKISRGPTSFWQILSATNRATRNCHPTAIKNISQHDSAYTFVQRNGSWANESLEPIDMKSDTDDLAISRISLTMPKFKTIPTPISRQIEES